MDNLSEKGLLLKKTRESRGISLDSVHEHTKIPLDSLRAIEEGYTIRTMSPFYQKGFLKIYAQFLDYDVKEFLGDFRPKEVASNTSPSEYPAFPRKNIATLQENNVDEPVVQKQKPLNTLSDRLQSGSPNNFSNISKELNRFQWSSVSKYLTPERLALAFKILGLAVAVFFFFKMVGCVAQKFSSKDKKSIQSKVSAAHQTGKSKKEKSTKEPSRVTPIHVEERRIISPVEEERIETAVVITPQESVQSVDAQPSVTLSLRAKRNSWLEVKIDGATVFSAVLKRGASETWSAHSEIEVSGKNLNQLEFEVNGKMIGVLGRGESHAKAVVINKNGLSLKK